MKDYIYQNTLINKKQLRQLLAWSFTKYDTMQACSLADELKYLGFKYASQAGISISIEDLRVPFIKNSMLQKAHQEILNAEKICVKGKITDLERFQKIIDTWNLSSEALKIEVVYFFKNFDPLNSVFIMAFSGARGNLSQVRQLVGMRGLMSDPSGEIMKLPIKKNFREGLTITDYLMSGYGARKGIVDTALKTANSGYLTRRLIDVAQDIIIREKDCLTNYSFLISLNKINQKDSNKKNLVYDKIFGRLLNKPIYNPQTNELITEINRQITPTLIQTVKQKNIKNFYIRSPLTCRLYRSICQKCYGWDLANENLVDMGEAIGIIAGQSIGEPGTQLTMRTFHTGGIFTSQASKQIVSPISGIIKFSKRLNTSVIRTNRGEDVVITKNSGSVIILPEANEENLAQVEVLRNTILFSKNNQYIKKNTIIGEVVKTEKQIRIEIKPIINNTSGEIFVPPVRNITNLTNKNILLWILAGQLYNSPIHSFLNYHFDHKISKNSYIFRTKIVNQYSGYIRLYNNSLNFIGKKYPLKDSKIKKLSSQIIYKNYLLDTQYFQYLINLKSKNSRLFLNKTRSSKFAFLLTNKFLTLTGGQIYYDLRSNNLHLFRNKLINYHPFNKFVSDDDIFTIKTKQELKAKAYLVHKTILWLPEETYKVNCDQSILLVEPYNFISKNLEIIPGIYSKTAGIVSINQKNNLILTITIQSGLVFEGKKFQQFDKKVFYPGETLLENIRIYEPCLCQYMNGKMSDQLLIRPLVLYEVPSTKSTKKIFGISLPIKSNLRITHFINYFYKTSQNVKSAGSLNLIANILNLNSQDCFLKNIEIEFLLNNKNEFLNLRILEELSLNRYLTPYLKSKNIRSCFLVKTNQFVDGYTTLGYLEDITVRSLEIVKFKSKLQNDKKVFLITNNDCVIINKNSLKDNVVNDLIINNINLNKTGRIIIENKQQFTIQKGRPYFFPNCKNTDLSENNNLQYRIRRLNVLPFSKSIKTSRIISLNYFNISKKQFKNELRPINKEYSSIIQEGRKRQITKLFLKKNGNLYSSSIPYLFKQISIKKNKNLQDHKIIQSYENKLITKLLPKSRHRKRKIPKEIKQITVKKSKSLLIKSSELISNKIKKLDNEQTDFILVRFLEFPFAKSVRIFSLSENLIEQEINNLYCQDGEFIASGETIGLLNFEKEITGDIVQGLPRIEQLLEARKNKLRIKRVPICQKKSLLVQKTSLDVNFEFRKVGTTINESDKINPHKLVKAYFNYYGLIKFFLCDRTHTALKSRLLDNFDASYRSFKKVQSLILNSVQSVYKSQGVTIADKHLEVIIKQMTTKVLVTFQGTTPLLPREVIDLYHIQYINKIIKEEHKQPAFYVPLLLGITKAALNNPSFISAASFQETTRVLTKAAIEGRVDWLRGLKENIITGHLIPAGTGSQSYANCFYKQFVKDNELNLKTVNFQLRNTK